MLSSLHWWGDESVQGLRRSCGLLAGYLYEPGMMKQNAEDYAKGLLPFLPERQWHTSRAGSLGGRLAGLRPATEELIAELLRLVQEFGFVSPAPVFVDLGSGDGRVVIAVARRLGIRGVGVEMDPQLLRQSVDEVPESLRGLVQFVQGDLAMVDVPSADIVFLYLPQERAWQGATLVNSERFRHFEEPPGFWSQIHQGLSSLTQQGMVCVFCPPVPSSYPD